MTKKILLTLFIVVLVGWLSLILVDYFSIKQNKDPKFCLKTETVKHADNKKTEICTGLGYKVQYYYNDDQLVASEIGPLFIVDRYAKEW